MSITPLREELVGSIWWCPVCQAYFAHLPGASISCAVNHPPGSCCHYSDRSVSEGFVSLFRVMLNARWFSQNGTRT